MENLTPQQKAKYLVNKFGKKIGIADKRFKEVKYDLRKAKELAIACVDEIIEGIDDCDTDYCLAMRETSDETTLLILRNKCKYYVDVKAEIQAM